MKLVKENITNKPEFNELKFGTKVVLRNLFNDRFDKEAIIVNFCSDINEYKCITSNGSFEFREIRDIKIME